LHLERAPPARARAARAGAVCADPADVVHLAVVANMANMANMEGMARQRGAAPRAAGLGARPADRYSPRAPESAHAPPGMPQSIQGSSIAPGFAVGPVHVVVVQPDAIPMWTVPGAEVDAEVERLQSAIRWALDDLGHDQKVVLASSGAKDAEIFSMQRVVLQDPGALRMVEGQIREQRVNAEAAVQRLIAQTTAKLAKLEGGGARHLAGDFSAPWRLVLDALLRRQREAVLASAEPVILAAAELTPQVVTYIDRERVLGVVTEAGGRFSHGAVLARSFGLPCVAGLGNLLARLEQGMTVGVDGGRGRVLLNPGPGELDELLERRRQHQAHAQKMREHAELDSVTTDGARFESAVNIESIRDLDTFDLGATDGVGLFRTEFLYMERAQFPSAEEQYRSYRRVLERMGRKPVTMRTLDIGGDKQLPYLKMPREANPALGWRGLRIALEWRDLLRVQLQALLRASAHGKLRILLPMVSSLEEVQETHRVFDQVRRDLIEAGYTVAPDIPVGIMVEVPSALLALEQLAPHVDFVSVGTNDLVQYLLAVDRDNSWVSKLYEPQHPAVLIALEHVAKAAAAAGKPASVCGDIACDPAVAVLLLGLGFQGVSVAPHYLAEVKYAVRRVSLEEARGWARQALAEASVAGVRQVLSAVRSRLYDQPT
jgi:phosphotransferase system enzyme I (PtsI)